MKRFFVIVWFFYSVSAVAQTTGDTLQLPVVETVAQKPGFTETGKKQQPLDSTVIAAFQGRHLGDLISAETATSFKTYGANGIVGAAMRGTSVDHTAVIWNGVNLQSPTHGQFDFSLLPVFFTDKVSVEPGAGTGAYGSGAVGGAVVLSNTIRKDKGFGGKVYLAGGSFNNKQGGLALNYSGRRFYSDTRVFHHTIDNNYPVDKFYYAANNSYYLLESPVKQQHSSFLQQGLMQQFNYETGAHSRISNIFLYTKADRLLTNSNGRQVDDDIRNVSTFNYSKNRIEFLTTLGIQREIIDYSDTISKISSLSRTISSWLQTGGKLKLSQYQSVYAYINPQLITAQVDGYGSSRPTQRRMSAWAGWNSGWFSGRLTTDISLKQQWINEKSLPLIPALGASYRLTDMLTLKAHSSSVFHAPDFNDLYWLAGGNPDLLPEAGWSHEAGLQLLKNGIKLEGTVFQNRVKNLIVWFPGTPYWSPLNVREVRSQGIEFNAKGGKQFGFLKLTADLGFSYVNSTTTKSLKAEDPALNRQQLFIPRENATARINAFYQNWLLGIHARYTGIRYISSDNQNWLPAYTIVDARLSKTLVRRNLKMELFAAANNIAGIFYMTMSGYPMPGRNYEAGITITINK